MMEPNGYWVTGMEDAWMWLKPLSAAGLDALEVSNDIFHGQEGEEVEELAALVALRPSLAAELSPDQMYGVM